MFGDKDTVVSVEDLIKQGSKIGMQNLVGTGRHSSVGGLSQKGQDIVKAFNQKFGTNYKNINEVLGSVTSEDEADPRNAARMRLRKELHGKPITAEQAKRNARLDFLKSQGAEIHSSNRVQYNMSRQCLNMITDLK